MYDVLPCLTFCHILGIAVQYNLLDFTQVCANYNLSLSQYCETTYRHIGTRSPQFAIFSHVPFWIVSISCHYHHPLQSWKPLGISLHSFLTFVRIQAISRLQLVRESQCAMCEYNSFVLPIAYALHVEQTEYPQHPKFVHSQIK